MERFTGSTKTEYYWEQGRSGAEASAGSGKKGQALGCLSPGQHEVEQKSAIM